LRLKILLPVTSPTMTSLAQASRPAMSWVKATAVWAENRNSIAVAGCLRHLRFAARRPLLPPPPPPPPRTAPSLAEEAPVPVLADWSQLRGNGDWQIAFGKLGDPVATESQQLADSPDQAGSAESFAGGRSCKRTSQAPPLEARKRRGGGRWGALKPPR